MLMEDLIDNVADYIISKIDAVGEDTIFSDLPSSPDKAVLIEQTGGPVGHFIYSYDTPRLRILVRGEKHDSIAPANTAYKIYDLLHGWHGGKLMDDGVYIHRIEGVQSAPIKVGPDDNNRHRYSINLDFEVHGESQNRE